MADFKDELIELSKIKSLTGMDHKNAIKHLGKLIDHSRGCCVIHLGVL